MTTPDYIADKDTILGLLQRGRGEGYRRVLGIDRSEAHSLLFQCITHDPRLDSQVESREEYYASIAIEVELPLGWLAEHLRHQDDQNQSSWATTLTVTTLTELAKRSYRDAEEILCDYIEWGQWWEWPLNDLLGLRGDELAPRIARAIERHFPTDNALDEAMRSWPTEQFVNLSRFSERIGVAISKVPPRIAEDCFSNAKTCTAQELLELANQKNYRALGKALSEIVKPTDVDLLVSHVSLNRPFAAHVALAGLTKLAPRALSTWLTDLWLGIPKKNTSDPAQNLARVILRQGISQAILALPAETTLPIARIWMDQEPQKRELGEKILQAHATIEDLALLRSSLRSMLDDEDAEWGCFLLKAFYNLPNVGEIQELIDIFHHFRFSMRRSYAAKAIQITSPDFFAKALALECLWDCEEGTRELGVKFVSLESTAALQRIWQQAEDAFENKEVRNEAKARLV